MFSPLFMRAWQRKGRCNMVEMYFKLVQAGLRTIDQVPLKYRADVQVLIDATV